MQTIMIVENDPDIRDGVRILLSGEGYRILDNITSNLLKYADPAQDISVRFVKENGKAGLAFANAVLPGRHQPLRHREVDGATGPRQHRQAGRGLGHERLQAL